MRRILYLITILSLVCTATKAQHQFNGTSLSEALIALDKSSRHYDISFVYDELEDFTVSKTIKRGRSLPDAVREVCGFYPVRITVKGKDILVECIQKDRTKLSGRLVDKDRQAVSYANIALYNPQDTTLIGGGVSNEAGDFVIPCSAAQARVRITCVGFKPIDRVMPIHEVGTLQMQQENNHLAGITVGGRMPVIRSDADRLQYIVANDQFASGLTALELLSRVPMVNIQHNQATILGKGTAHFMLNGRVVESGDESIWQKLWAMRSDDIERIEVISIPAGRYQTELGGGYINIVLNRDQAHGWRGDFSGQGSRSDDWSARLASTVSYASERLDWTTDIDASTLGKTTENHAKYGTIEANNYYLDAITRTNARDKAIHANTMLRYRPSENLELGAIASHQRLWAYKTIEDSTVFYATYLNLSPLNYSSQSTQHPGSPTQTTNLTAYCDWRLDKMGKQISASYNFFQKKDNCQSDMWSEFLRPNLPTTLVFSGFNNSSRYRIQTAKLDLSLPWEAATVDAGVSYSGIDNLADIKDSTTSSFSYLVSDLLGHFHYKEHTLATYVTAHKDWRKLSASAGIRYEHTKLKGEQEMDNAETYWFYNYQTIKKPENNRAYDHWFPTASLTYRPAPGKQLSLSWGKGLVRPSFNDLNPFRLFSSWYIASEGNPTLLPSYTNHLELSYLNSKGLYANLYHHHGSDQYDWNYIFGYSANSSYTYSPLKRTPETCFDSQRTGLYLRYQHHLSPSTQLTAEGECYYYDIDFTPTYAKGSGAHGWGENLALSADTYLNRQHTLLLTARYNQWLSDYVGLTKFDAYGYFSFSLHYSMLDDRLKLSLTVTDPFHQYITDSHHFGYNNGYYGGTLDATEHIDHHARAIGLTATYAIGGRKVRHIKYDRQPLETKRAE